MRNMALDLSDPQDVKLFVAEFRDDTDIGARLLEEGYFTGPALELILAETQRRFGDDDISMKKFCQTATQLYLTGAFILPGVKKEPEVEPEVPVDKNGRKLAGKALTWYEWEKWVSDPNTPSRAVELKRNSDPAFREFFEKRVRGFSDNAGDGVKEAGTVRVDDDSVSITPELRTFARNYNSATIEQVNTMKRASTNPDGAAGAAEFNRLVDLGIKAGLI